MFQAYLVMILVYEQAYLPSTNSQIWGRLRLDGLSSTKGRLEVESDNGTWGTVCDNAFDNIDATVACRQLGFSHGETLGNSVANGTGDIYLDNLNCTGRESRLIYCPSSGWGNQNCSHSKDVGILCYGKVRLAGGNNTSMGRLEVSTKSGEWGTVCSNNFDDKDAVVACRQLGFRYGVSLSNTVDDGTGTIYIDELRCIGNEIRLLDCPNNSSGHNNCSHSEDVGIKCLTTVDGGWGSWYRWSSCSARCGGGIQYRYRVCNNPVPNYGGNYCFGSSVKSRRCNTVKCRVHGAWSSWLSWSYCNVTCGSGTQYRKRQCSNPAPKHGGKSCSGAERIYRTCNSLNCPGNVPTKKCNDSEFTCTNGDCVDGSYKCDEQIDCYDESDEADCPPVKCNDDEFRCLNKQQCIRKQLVCNRQYDCSDDSDEDNCPDRCRLDQFQCRDGQCIDAEMRCNNDYDCNDYSDEEECSAVPPCLSGLYRCDDGQCVNADAHCNNIVECTDKSDEKNCESSRRCSYSILISVGASIGSVVFVAVIIGIICTIRNKKMTRKTAQLERKDLLSVCGVQVIKSEKRKVKSGLLEKGLPATNTALANKKIAFETSDV